MKLDWHKTVQKKETTILFGNKELKKEIKLLKKEHKKEIARMDKIIEDRKKKKHALWEKTRELTGGADYPDLYDEKEKYKKLVEIYEKEEENDKWIEKVSAILLLFILSASVATLLFLLILLLT